MKCIHCKKEVAFDYRRDQEGNYFCNDKCYEAFDHGEVDLHPYIDTYEMVRRDYLMWEDIWDLEIESYDNYLQGVDEVYRSLNSYKWDYSSFYSFDPGDGVYAHEIYLYLQRIDELIEKVLAWRPKGKPYFGIVLFFNREIVSIGSSYKNAYDVVYSFLSNHMNNYVEDKEIYEALKDGQDYYRFGAIFHNEYIILLDDQERAERVKQMLSDRFAEDIIKIKLSEFYKCNCGCNRITTEEKAFIKDGWFLDPMCKQEYEYYYT